MIELSARILISGALIFLAGVFGKLNFEVCWKASAASIALGFFLNRLEDKGLRNPGISGFFAVADAALVALVIGSADQLPQLGFVALVPCAWAARKHGAQALYMAPIVAGLLLATYSFQHRGEPPVALLVQAVGVLGVGLLLGHDRIVATIAKPVTQEVHGTTTPYPVEELLDVREKYRTVRDAYAELERRSQRDRYVVALSESKKAPVDTYYADLAIRFGELIGCPKLVLYTLAGYDNAMVVRGTYGDLPDSLSSSALDVDIRQAPIRLRDQSEEAIQALRQVDGVFANVLFNYRGKIVGLACLLHDNPHALDSAHKRAEDAADAMATMIVEGTEREETQRRLRESELLYDLATLGESSSDLPTVYKRFARELKELLVADHLSVCMIEQGEIKTSALEGTDCRLLEVMSFAEGPGVSGWQKIGCPELFLFDVRSDSRCPGKAALTARVGSFLLVPLVDGDTTIGYVAAATFRNGALDLGAAETMRIAAAELSRQLTLMDTHEFGGILDQKEFSESIANRNGALVVLEPLRQERLLETYGKAAMQHTLRKFSRRVRAKLPANGVVCRREIQDLIVFLPGFDQSHATSWANEMAASASLIGLRTPDGRTRMPFAVRAKVAVLNPQHSQFLPEMSA